MSHAVSKKRKVKPREAPKHRKKAKPTFRCCGRTFKTKSGLAAHRRGMVHFERNWKPPRVKRWRLPKPSRVSKPVRTPQPPPVRKCGYCGDPGDHGGDGHPFEKSESPEIVVVPRARTYRFMDVFKPLRERDVLR